MIDFMSDLVIRQAELSDVETIERFDVFSGSRQNEVERGEVTVAVKNDLVVGYLTADKSFFLKPFIRYLCVAEEFEGQGIANELLNRIEKAFAGERVFTSTESNNLTMLHVFKKRGYQMSGVVENLQKHSEIIFCKDL